jgi:hypothetical protein
MWYRTGTIAATKSSKTVTGTGTKWADAKQGVGPGQMLLLPTAGTVVMYEIASVQSNTQLTLVDAFTGTTVTAQAYAIVTTYIDSVPDFARRLANQLSDYQSQLDGWQSILAGTGDVTLTAPDGTIVTIPTISKLKSDSLSRTSTTDQTVVSPVTFTKSVTTGSASVSNFLKVSSTESDFLPTSQGSYMTWNRSPGSGFTDFLNHRGNGGGGFNFIMVDSTAAMRLFFISGVGDLQMCAPQTSIYGRLLNGVTQRLIGIDPVTDNVIVSSTAVQLNVHSSADIIARIAGTNYTLVSTRNFGNGAGDQQNQMGAGAGGWLGTTSPAISDIEAVSANQLWRASANATGGPDATAPWAGFQFGFDGASRWTMCARQGVNTIDLRTRVRAPSGWGSWVAMWHTGNTSVDANGFIKKASPIARLTNHPDKMQSDFLDGFTLSGLVAVNPEATGVTAVKVATGVYEVTGSLGFSLEGWTVEIPQDVNGNRLCFVATEVDHDGKITVLVSKRRFDIDTAAIVAGDPMDIPDGRWIDLRINMPASDVEDMPEVDELIAQPEECVEATAY